MLQKHCSRVRNICKQGWSKNNIKVLAGYELEQGRTLECSSIARTPKEHTVQTSCFMKREDSEANNYQQVR